MRHRIFAGHRGLAGGAVAVAGQDKGLSIDFVADDSVYVSLCSTTSPVIDTSRSHLCLARYTFKTYRSGSKTLFMMGVRVLSSAKWPYGWATTALGVES